MRKAGFVSPQRAATILGVHRNTVYNWAIRAMQGDFSRLRVVERNEQTGYLRISLEDVVLLKRSPLKVDK